MEQIGTGIKILVRMNRLNAHDRFIDGTGKSIDKRGKTGQVILGNSRIWVW